MTWVESVSPSFRARYESEDADAVERMIEELERFRDRLERLLPRTPGEVEVVVHARPALLDVAAPSLVVARRLDAPAARRYRAGAASGRRIDVLSPHALRERASGAPGSAAMLGRLPQVLYARLALLELHPGLRRPWSARGWAWLLEGGSAWLGGQVAHARAAITRRLREGPAPAFPPARPDATLLGGTLFDLLDREEGERAAVGLALASPPGAPAAALAAAFHGRSPAHTEAAWRAHLDRLAGRPEDDDGRRASSRG
jgi:hypothetical protein